MNNLPNEFDIHNKNDIKFSYPKGQEYVFNAIWAEIWDNMTYSHSGCKIHKNDVVIDVGANIGIFSEWAFVQGASKVYGLEPEAENFKHLVLNSPRTQAFQLGLSHKIGEQKLYFDSIHTGHSLCKPPDYHRTQSGETVVINTVTLEEFMKAQNISQIDFLKIDAEGAEIDILHNLPKLYKKIKKIALEFHVGLLSKDKFKTFVEFLKQHYRYVSTDVDGLPLSPRTTNVMIYAWEPRKYVTTTVKDEKEDPSVFSYSFLDGPVVSIEGNETKLYTVKFTNLDTGILEYETQIAPGHWSKANQTYFANWFIEIFDGDKKVNEHTMNLKGKTVHIRFDSSCVGDSLAWIPYVEIFQKKHECKVAVTTFKNYLFDKYYKDITFYEPGSTVPDVYAQFNLGIYYKEHGRPSDPRTLPLQHIAAEILGLPLENAQAHINPIKEERPIKEKYVCIAPHSTAQAKYWNNPGGWQEVVNYLTEQGYKVINLSKEENTYMGNDPIDGVEDHGYLQLRQLPWYLKHAEAFIGLSSGLAWLSWAVGQKTIMISGFTETWYEFPTSVKTVRIGSPVECKGCFNDKDILFDRGDWNWCPRHKDTDRQFECSKNITATQVIEAFNKLNPKFITPPGHEKDLEFLISEILENGEYEHDTCSIKSGDVVVDVGANIGIFSHWAFEQGASQVYSIEPESKNVICLAHNAPKAKHFEMGLSNETTTKDLYIDGVIGGHSIVTPRANHPTQTGTTTLVKTMTLRDFMDAQNISQIDFLKVDTEGSEIDILFDLQKLAPRISKVVLEFHHSVHDDLKYESFIKLLSLCYDEVDIKKRTSESIIYAWQPKQKNVLLKKSKVLLQIECPAIGDTLAASAVLHKLAGVYGEPIDVYTWVPELFKNNPDVNLVIDMAINNVDVGDYDPKHSHITFNRIHERTFKHNLVDIRQYHANFLGFELLPEERECIFIPDQKGVLDLPAQKYVVLHPSETWPSRSWSEKNWQLLADNLWKENIAIVLVGKDTSEHLSSTNSRVDKPTYKIALKNGVDYTNKLTLSETWHVINEAEAVITMDSSILHLAGTTNTHIIQLGSSIDPKLRAPYRQGTQDYKYSYIPGSCSLFCGSNMAYGLKEHNNITGVPVISNCLENKTEFECHPSVKNVVNEVKKVYI